ncbi:CHAT domain-containing protein [Verrucomicrobiaceae bacterium 227]
MLFPIRLLSALIVFACLARAELNTVEQLAKKYEVSRSEEDLWKWVEALAQSAWRHTEADDHGKAVIHYRSALTQLPPEAKNDEPGFVSLLHDGLGRALQNTGELVEARRHLREAVRLRRDGPETQLGISEGHLGLLELTLGHYREAGRLFYSALKHTPPEEKALLAHRYECLGRYYLSLRSHSRAAEYFARAMAFAPNSDLQINLALCRFRGGDPDGALLMLSAMKGELDDPLRRASLLNLEATICQALKQTDLAEKLQQEAIELLTKTRGAAHPSLAPLLANLGVLRFESGRVDEAISPLEQAKDLLKDRIESHHQSYVEILYYLAACRPGKESIQEARSAANVLLEKLVASGGERELLAFRSQIDLHSIVCRLGDAGLIAESLFQGKGRIMEAVLDRRETENRILSKRLALDQLQLKGVGEGDLQLLRDEIERLELENSGKPSLKTDWKDLAKALPPGVVFVDFVRYQESDWRYGAVVFDRTAQARWVPLGSEKQCNRLGLLQRSLRERAEVLRQGKGKGGMPMLPLLQDLYRDFWQPIAEVLPKGTREVVVCPEGMLHLLPWSVLCNRKNGAFLCQELPQLTVLDSGRRLLRPTVPPVALSKPWLVFGISDFSWQRTTIAGGDLLWSSSLRRLDDLASVKSELESLQGIAPKGSGIFLNGKATQKSLLEIEAPPAVLHLASHGFHHRLDSDEELAPFYESGIVMGMTQEEDDFLLFTDEVASLNLEGTRLVTLSTCRSASGRPVPGEGIMGLGRGFIKAGARHILASLWEIPDESTAEFMKEFYQRLQSGNEKPSSLLWQMQREAFSKREGNVGKMETMILSYGGFSINSSDVASSSGR